MVHIWTVGQMQQNFRLLQGIFLKVFAEFSAGLETQHTNQELLQPQTFCIESGPLKGDYSLL